jgi:hypothetical protein
MHLTDLQTKVEATLAKADLKLDDYSRAHLFDAKLRIKQTLEAESDDFGKPQAAGGGGSLFLFRDATRDAITNDRNESIETTTENLP